jgi:uncharacterized protein (TIGR03066 family)
MRIVLGFALMAVMGAVSADDEKIDTKKLVGKWETNDKDKGKLVIEFSKDGKYQIATGRKEDDLGGTYTVDGNMVKISQKSGDIEIMELMIISKLSDTELICVRGQKKQSESFTRIK